MHWKSPEHRQADASNPQEFSSSILGLIEDNKLLNTEPFILAFSNYIWNVDLSYQIATIVKNKYPKIIGEIRGIGLIKGLKMLVDNVEFIKKLMNHKMLTVKAEENVIRLFPPLIVENKELDEAINKIEKVCKEMS